MISPFTRGHRCKKLFWLEVIDEEEVEVTEEATKEEQPEIPLNTIIGVSSMQNMLLRGELGTKIILALIDSGSTHSFFNEDVKSLNPFVEQLNGLKVVVANGERVKSKGLCRKVPLKFNHYCFYVDLYILSLNEYDVVLGENWMQTLRSILWDFKSLCLLTLMESRSVYMALDPQVSQQRDITM